MSEYMPDNERLQELLLGKSIVSAHIDHTVAPDEFEAGPVGTLTLSDGTVLKVWGNHGCLCTAGSYPLSHLSATDNIITNVEVESKPYERRDGYYKIFVYANNERINVATFHGDDGNGFYGTGWWLKVEHVKETVNE